MKVSEADILIVPGYTNSGPEHWQSRWQAKLSTARRVEQEDWDEPDRNSWVAHLVAEVAACERPVILVAHSLGVATVVHAAAELPAGRVRGAFLVGYPDVENPATIPAIELGFARVPRDPLPFPSLLVASHNDPYCEFEVAADLANAWGSMLIDAGEAGHLNAASGHGPWPEGSFAFGRFLGRLSV